MNKTTDNKGPEDLACDAYMPAHDEAVALGRDHYIDPQTGLISWTSLYLEKRGYCCQSACRHCPYENKDV